MSESHSSPSRLGLWAGFAAVYLIWGSTYLAIRYAIQTLPPFLMAGGRFFLSGLILVVFLAVRREPLPPRRDWRGAFLVGVLLLVGGNGSVVWAEQRVPSGVTAMLIACTPFWMILFDRLSGGLLHLRARTVIAMAVGFFGVFLLIYPKEVGKFSAIPLLPALAIVGAGCWWSLGSILARHVRMPSSPWWTTTLQMLAGGIVLLVLGTLHGEWSRLDFSKVSRTSCLAWIYLVGFGSIVGYSSYLWILRHSTPTRVSTYAFVNPVVALFLGWALAGEAITPRTLVAAALILPSVLVLISGKEERNDHGRQGGKLREGLDSSLELS